MREGIDAASPCAGGADGALAGGSLAHADEELVRAGGGHLLRWGGTSLTTHFQPIYCVRRGSCLGFEALARASDADGRAIRPEDFFSRTASADRALLDWACRALHLRNYTTVDPGDRTLFINVHPEAAVRDARRGREFAALIRYYGLVPKRACVEILDESCSDEGLLRVAVEGIQLQREALLAIGAKADSLQGFYLASPNARLNDEVAGTAILDQLLNSPALRAA